MIDLDLLIIGGYYGKGKRRGVISHFLLALLEKGNYRLNYKNYNIHFVIYYKFIFFSFIFYFLLIQIYITSNLINL